ncbi:MAG: helix-turn-helix domain-containing protein [Myxococcales bacterium]|nr:helix-turn-helix domain-containing protein [Myxococcales bacterium]
MLPTFGAARQGEGRGFRLLTVAEVSKQLGVSPATVYKLCAQGELPSTRVANSIRIAPGDLTAYLGRSRR